MSKPVAHVGSIVRVGSSTGQVISGASKHLVGNSGAIGADGLTDMQRIFETIGNETEDMSPSERRAHIRRTHGAGVAEAYERTANAGIADASPADIQEGPAKQSVSVGCQGITNETPNSFKISANYTVADLCTNGHRIANRTPVGLSRADVICNLRHLSQNTLEPFRVWVARRFPNTTVKISSGYRANSGGSDHNRGFAVDIHLYRNSARLSRSQLLEVAKVIAAEQPVPFTQFLLEYQNGASLGWLHFANRRNGQNSNKRIGAILNAGSSGSVVSIPNRI